MVEFKDIEKSYEIIKNIAKKTPLRRSKTFSNMTNSNLYLKLENLQTTGSFKIRGAYNKIYHLTEKERKKGVVCSSAGNHAQGVAYASSILGVESTIFMPVNTPPTKIIATKGYGAKVVLEGKTYDDAYLGAKKLEKEKDMTFVHAFNDKHIVSGQGTIGIEIFEDLKDVDMVLVPIGGGGLISGISIALKHLKPDVKIIGVEAEGASSVKLSLNKNKITPTKEVNTIADGIAVKNPGKLTFNFIKKYVDDVVTVNDDEIANTLYMLLQRAKLVVEPAGAVTLAAALNKKVKLPENVVVLLSGGNIDLSLLTQVIEKGKMQHSLLSRFSFIIPDKPKALKDILSIFANLRVNVDSISHDRCTTSVPLGHVKITATLQTLGKEHIKEIKEEFKKHKIKYQILN